MLSAIAAPDADSLTCRNGFRRQPGCLGSTVDLHRPGRKNSPLQTAAQGRFHKFAQCSTRWRSQRFIIEHLWL